MLDILYCFTQICCFGWYRKLLSLSQRFRGTALHATRLRVHSPASERAVSEQTAPTARRNEDVGQAAASALVLFSTSQR